VNPGLLRSAAGMSAPKWLSASAMSIGLLLSQVPAVASEPSQEVARPHLRAAAAPVRAQAAPYVSPHAIGHGSHLLPDTANAADVPGAR
jgi:hypothetical protein